MGLKDKIIMGHLDNIARKIFWGLMIVCGIVILLIIGNSIFRGDIIDKPMGPEHNWVVPHEEPTHIE